MEMARKFKELQAKMPRENEEAAKKMISEMGLAELRESRTCQTSFDPQNGTTPGPVHQQPDCLILTSISLFWASSTM